MVTFLTFRTLPLAGLFLGVILPLQAWMAAEAGRTPAGLWQTVDDKTHKPRGMVRIYEENGMYWGRIESSVDPRDASEHCDKCAGDRKDAPIIGLLIVREMKKHGDEYSGGDILDPDTGSVYKCRITVSADGGRLIVRGFIGVSLLGRTQTWTRVNE
jgi:uncharacterized protein (DUF2147 family)